MSAILRGLVPIFVPLSPLALAHIDGDYNARRFTMGVQKEENREKTGKKLETKEAK